MNHDSYDDGYIRGILNTVKTIAMVGVSPKESRPSYFAFTTRACSGSPPTRSSATFTSRSTWSIFSAPRRTPSASSRT